MDRATTEAAFRNTRYVVQLPDEEAVVRIDQPLPSTLRRWLQAVGRDSLSLLTADNPGAIQRSERDNIRERDRLLRELDHLALPCLPTVHVAAPRSQWPAEYGWAVANLPLDKACQLARSCQQLAFVRASIDEPARLIWLNEPGSGPSSAKIDHISSR
jgi:hypothetical protein